MFSCMFRPLGGAMESFKCNLIFFSTFQSLDLLQSVKVQCNLKETSGYCTNLVRGTLQLGPPRSQFSMWVTLNMFSAGLLLYHAFWMETLQKLSRIQKAKKARDSPTELDDTSRTQEQAMEVLFLRWICHSGALEEETPAAWVSRRQSNCAQLG